MVANVNLNAVRNASPTRPLNEVVDIANSGQGVGNLNKAEWAMVAANPGYTTPNAAAAAQQATPEATGDGNTDGTDDYVYNYDTDPETMRMREQQAYEAAVRAAEEAKRQQNAIATMKALLTDYGLTALYDRVVGFIKEGYDADAVMVLIRTTPEYKQRFPAMEALAKQGRAISEGEYIDYEKTASGLERRYGLPEGMLMGNVTDLLTNEVSATELNDRVMLASAASIQAPDDVKNTFRDYYGVSEGGLTAYFLDPEKATPLLEKQYAASLIGVEAARQGVGMDVYGSENLQALGVSQEQARQGFGQVARGMSLTEGRGDVVSQQQLISGTFAQDENALKAIERASKARTGRFQEGGSYAATTGGVGGLGSAATR